VFVGKAVGTRLGVSVGVAVKGTGVDVVVGKTMVVAGGVWVDVAIGLSSRHPASPAHANSNRMAFQICLSILLLQCCRL
jgi:hypothetical protein